jgi:hypothetical protein
MNVGMKNLSTPVAWPIIELLFWAHLFSPAASGDVQQGAGFKADLPTFAVNRPGGSKRPAQQDSFPR